MFRQIYELTVLGMHPASLYPRRSRVAPMWESALAERSRGTRTLIVGIGSEGGQIILPAGVARLAQLDLGSAGTS